MEEVTKAVIGALAELVGLTTEEASYVEPGQPYRLHLLEALARYTEDPDLGLHVRLQEGVYTGCVPEQPISSSHTW